MREKRTFSQRLSDAAWGLAHPTQKRITVPGGHDYGPRRDPHETYETDQPWVIYTYLTTDRRSRITGVSRIRCTCAACGKKRVLRMKIPRTGEIVDRGKHPERIRFLLDHLRCGEAHPMSWQQPLLNPAAHTGGIDLDLLAMRLQADLNEADSS